MEVLRKTARVALQERCLPHTVSLESQMSAKPRIACMPNGPYYLLNDMQALPVPNLERSSGAACATVRGVALCRCGGSKNKPFCDGTHVAIGFDGTLKS